MPLCARIPLLVFVSTVAAFAQQAPQNLDLFLLIGQSNMAGRGVVEEQDREPLPGIYVLDQNLNWRPATDPLHFDKPAIAGAGIGRSFARRLLRETAERQIGLIPCAFGGTSLNEWAPGGKLFNDAVRRTRAAESAGRLRGILWHQGESDSSDRNLASTYRERFAHMIEALRSELNARDAPVIVGALGEYLYTRGHEPFARVVNEQLAGVPAAVPHCAFVPSEGLDHKGDQLHFNTASLREFGRRYAHAYLMLDPAWDRPPVPGVIIDHWPKNTGRYVGSPSIAILPNGDYIASHDLFGPDSEQTTRPITRVFRSSDRGLHWSLLTEIPGAFWSTLFVHGGALYLMGTDREYGDTVIRRSNDGGRTWTEPLDENNGLLLKGGYHCAPQPAVVHDGRIWRGMEDIGAGGGWGKQFRAFMMSAPSGADLLKAASWTSSNALARSADWLDGDFGGWLEGNAIVTPDGTVVDMLRVDTSHGEKAAMVHISADGATATFDPATGFIDFPGAAKKFTIRYDPRTKLYWSLANYIPPQYEGAARPGAIRNTLALTSSPDLRNWKVNAVVLSNPDHEKHGFQYVDWQFDGDDLVFACRTAFDDEDGGAHNYHDANFLTFHRLRDFRGLKQ